MRNCKLNFWVSLNHSHDFHLLLTHEYLGISNPRIQQIIKKDMFSQRFSITLDQQWHMNSDRNISIVTYFTYLHVLHFLHILHTILLLVCCIFPAVWICKMDFINMNAQRPLGLASIFVWYTIRVLLISIIHILCYAKSHLQWTLSTLQ